MEHCVKGPLDIRGLFSFAGTGGKEVANNESLNPLLFALAFDLLHLRPHCRSCVKNESHSALSEISVNEKRLWQSLYCYLKLRLTSTTGRSAPASHSRLITLTRLVKVCE